MVRLADAVATRLREAGVGARTLTLKVRFSDGFHTITRSTTSPEATDQAGVIVALVGPMLEAIDPTPGLRLLGVSASNLGPVHHQLSLGLADDDPDDPVMGETLDRIRERFGSDAIGPASAVREGEVRNVKRGGQQWGPDA